ncbi:Hint domain-containing protein [Frigidibacter sp. MR17.24]|uniref:Hint domain-containing protein n=1 Tax=Frigidibacter sp. MR17.24 TaxID=3127345 RepID=UPI003012CF8D
MTTPEPAHGHDTATAPPSFALQLFAAEDIWVVAGANQGDGLDQPETCEAGDIYRLDTAAAALTLRLAASSSRQSVAPGSQIGAAGDGVTPVALLHLMAPDGDRLELMVIRHDPTGAAYVLPFSPLAPRTDYTLISTEPPPPEVHLADVACASFGAGTMITMASGAQRAIETLAPGDRVLTRDNGAQPVRWIGRATLRAQGGFAPVVLAPGALGNADALVVSQHHRLFLYQRGTARIAGTAELLVQAKHLLTGAEIRLRDGGWIDYYALVFDRHEILYAEGIPCESLMVCEATLGLMPRDISDEVRARFPGLDHAQHFGTETALDATDRAALLRARGRG